jgi:hypothetical protein
LLFLPLALLFFEALSFFDHILILPTERVFDLALLEFILHELLFEVLVVLENLLKFKALLEELLLFVEKLFELGLFEVRSGDLVVEEADFLVILNNVFFKNVHLGVDMPQLAFAEHFWIFLV